MFNVIDCLSGDTVASKQNKEDAEKDLSLLGGRKNGYDNTNDGTLSLKGCINMPRRGRPENLIPNSQRTPEELREMTRKGGIASGETRRFKKTLREIMQEFYDEETGVTINGKKATGSELAKHAVATALRKGDKTSVQALGVLASLDEKKVEVNASVQSVDLTEGMTNEELRAAIEAMENGK